MIMITIFLFAFTLYIFGELVPLFKQKQWKVFWISTIILLLDLTLVLLTALGIPVPSPSFPVKRIVFSFFSL